jgi:membrane-bound hydrogenase subunit beta
MQSENEIVTALCEKFDFLKGKISVRGPKRIFTQFLAKEEFEQVFYFVHDEMGFSRAHHVIGTDEGDDLGFIYLLSNSAYIILALKEKAPKSDPRINTMSCVFPTLLVHERELVDLFGAIVEGLPEGLTYPLPDGWPKGNYPMRKEWNPAYFDQATMTYNPPPVDTGKEAEGK